MSLHISTSCLILQFVSILQGDPLCPRQDVELTAIMVSYGTTRPIRRCSAATVSADILWAPHVGHRIRQDTVQCFRMLSALITPLPRAPVLNKKQSTTAARPLEISSIFPQGTAPTQPPIHYASKLALQTSSNRTECQAWWRTIGRWEGIKAPKFPGWKIFHFALWCCSLFFLCLCCYLRCMFMCLAGPFLKHKSSVILIGCV